MRLTSLWVAASAFALATWLVSSINRASADGGGGALPPCVPDGGSEEYCFDRPPLDGAGDPVDAEWVDGDGNPVVREHDPITPDDPMGDATGSDPACTDIANSGGDLSGTSGGTQNGTGEGDCIEIKIRWRYRYRMTHTVTITSTVQFTSKDNGTGGGGSAGGSTAHAKTVWGYGYKYSAIVEVCPC